MYELKLKDPGKPDIHWKQSVNPASGESLLNGKFEYVEDTSPVWHLMFKQEGCEVTYDAGAEIFNALFDRSTWPIVRFDRTDELTQEMAPYAYYRRVTTIPREMSLYDTLLLGIRFRSPKSRFSGVNHISRINNISLASRA